MSANPPSPGPAALVAPVSRRLRVADPARTIAFYRDVVGFEATNAGNDSGLNAVAAVVRGPARLEIIARSANETHEPAILFFQTDDVAALHADVIARGGQPSALEKVNWIKTRMFEVRDPDGHTLWFGQSYHEPSADRTGQLRKILPELPVTNVSAAVAHYRDVLGFHVNHAQDDLGVMDRDEITLLLIPRTERHRGIGSCYVYIRDADALHAELTVSGAHVLDAPVSHPWGLRDFHVLDPDGNQLTFGQTFE